MDANDDARFLDKRGVLTFIASRLAPTGAERSHRFGIDHEQQQQDIA